MINALHGHIRRSNNFINNNKKEETIIKRII